MGKTANKRGLVVGGTGGIGRVAADRLAAAGVDVYLTGRRARPGLPGTFVPWEFESAVSSIRELEGAVGGFGSWDYLVCAYGPCLTRSLAQTNDALWQYQVEANLALPGMLVSRVLPGMESRCFGRILLFGAAGGDALRARMETAVYQAAKAGLGVLAKSVARQSSALNITCNVICPGYAITEYYSEEDAEDARRRVPGGNPSVPEDFGPIIENVLLQEKNLLNGAIITAGQGL